ncbi:unnamed protein product [Arabidopsis thaliana]|uniref:Uncharacterized protein n=2 Tax=Arabidopsis thaliana TaxID=3702 RepID=A0A654G6A3_ARATH|nr:uncharacterized protein AT5G37715 [Arabidopsis thaliana]ANM70687.1 hypothetical protein AT5G37715 [Arabidopsis thaliana]CAA0405962.1 unnamed protein product [Arabidopsis thaliana]VYS68523.1 unnamed protein product [Arabidopsis thaliana]|eukprot:NP_001332274.1 hypothetical protein AT5G37715 [Arabidopsis thaliana]
MYGGDLPWKSEERLKLFGSKMRLENLGFRNQMKD